MRTRLLSLALVMALAASGSIALAGPGGERLPAGPGRQARDQALALHAAGSKAFGERRYQDAIDLFLQADGLVKNASFAYNVAGAYEQLGDRAKALRWFREYLRRAPRTSDRAQVEQRISRLRQALQDEALALYHQGREAFTAQWFEEAIGLFLQADGLVKNASFAYNVAGAYEQLGDRAKALSWFREYLRRAPLASDRLEVKERIARLEQTLRDKGVQQVTILSTPEGATLLLDGTAVGITPWTTELAPGRHQATLRRRGYRDLSREFKLPADRAIDVRLVLQRHAAAAPARAGPATRPQRQIQGGGVQPLTWITLGVGVASLAAALGCEFGRASAEDAARNAPDQITAGAYVEAMEDRRTAALVLVSTGAAATVLGGALLAVDLWPRGESEQASARVDLGLLGSDAGTFGIAVSGAF